MSAGRSFSASGGYARKKGQGQRGVSSSSSPMAAVATCGDRSALESIPIYLSRPNVDGTQDVFGLVADRVTAVGEACVIGNTFVIDDAPTGEYTMRSTAGSRAIKIGAE